MLLNTRIQIIVSIHASVRRRTTIPYIGSVWYISFNTRLREEANGVNMESSAKLFQFQYTPP